MNGSDCCQNCGVPRPTAWWEPLPSEQREQIKAASMGMWAPYLNSTKKHVSGAEIVHDKFHVSKHLNEAVDQVRRSEHTPSESARSSGWSRNIEIF